MERATKILVWGWVCVALSTEIVITMPGWPTLLPLACFVSVLGLLLAMYDERSIALALVSLYLFPTIIYLLAGGYVAQLGSLWMAGLAGALLPRAIKTSWRIPVPFRAPLVCWALVIVVGATIVAAREIDFTPGLMRITTLSNSSTGLWPAYVVGWVLHVALVLVLGILWFDWLCGMTAANFRPWVIAPMAASCLVLVAASVYQMFVDVTALNPTVYGGVGRAGGTMLDGNASGMIAAVWIGGLVLLALVVNRWRWPLTIGAGSAWLAVWASGSRTALAAAVIVTAFSAIAILMSRAKTFLRLQVSLPLVLVVLVAVLGLALFLGRAHQVTVGPVQRLRDLVSTGSWSTVAGELWQRNGYGTVATQMLRDSPWFGFGPGFFHILVPDFSPGLPRDNAQNWYRHQLVEFGLIGSLAWIAWAIGFARFVMKERNIPATAWITRGVLVAMAGVSLLAMPTQEVAVAVTFWTFAFWYLQLVEVPVHSGFLKPRSWVAIGTIVLIFGVGTAYLASTRLRVARRAERVGWPYAYGFYPPELDPEGGEYQWTGRRALTVIEAPAPWMALTVSVDYPGLAHQRDAPASHAVAIRPVDVKVWRDGEIAIDMRLTDTSRITRYIVVPRGAKRVLLETEVSRTMRGVDFGGSDDRQLGLMVKWSFVDRPATTAAVVPALR